MISVLLLTKDATFGRHLADAVTVSDDVKLKIITPVPVKLEKDVRDTANIILVISQGTGEEGLELLGALRSAGDSVPFFIDSRVYDSVVSFQALKNGADYYTISEPPEENGIQLIIEKAAALKRYHDALGLLNRKLLLVGSVTRHDVLNQLTAISGYTELLAMMIEDPVLKGYLEKERSALEKIRRQFQYAKDYQNIGVEAPCWQRIKNITNSMNDLLDLGSVRITVEPETAIIFADPLFSKVIYNLFENALRHGENVSEIGVTLREKAPGAVLSIEDNGIGVPQEEKSRIFERGYGKNTGWGLFLAREILAMTDMTIEENGEPGKGARFDIYVPAGKFHMQEIPGIIIS